MLSFLSSCATILFLKKYYAFVDSPAYACKSAYVPRNAALLANIIKIKLTKRTRGRVNVQNGHCLYCPYNVWSGPIKQLSLNPDPGRDGIKNGPFSLLYVG
jgi:hypothetical protein